MNKRTELMAQYQAAAKEADRIGDVVMRRQWSNEWHELATASEDKLAPAYLTWAGRLAVGAVTMNASETGPDGQKWTVMVSKGSTDGLDYSGMLGLFYGDVSPWHQTRLSAQAALRTLKTSGDWPDGRPHYWVAEGYEEIPWF